MRSVIVGNEVLLRGDLPVAQLLRDIRQVRSALGHTVAISYADDYHQWLAHPELAQAVDFVTVHIYPFFQNVPIGSAVSVLSNDYRQVAGRFPGKQVVIGETGWPSRDGHALPGSSYSESPEPGALLPRLRDLGRAAPRPVFLLRRVR